MSLKAGGWERHEILIDNLDHHKSEITRNAKYFDEVLRISLDSLLILYS